MLELLLISVRLIASGRSTKGREKKWSCVGLPDLTRFYPKTADFDPISSEISAFQPPFTIAFGDRGFLWCYPAPS